MSATCPRHQPRISSITPGARRDVSEPCLECFLWAISQCHDLSLPLILQQRLNPAPMEPPLPEVSLKWIQVSDLISSHWFSFNLQTGHNIVPYLTAVLFLSLEIRGMFHHTVNEDVAGGTINHQTRWWHYFINDAGHLSTANGNGSRERILYNALRLKWHTLNFGIKFSISE